MEFMTLITRTMIPVATAAAAVSKIFLKKASLLIVSPLILYSSPEISLLKNPQLPLKIPS